MCESVALCLRTLDRKLLLNASLRISGVTSAQTLCVLAVSPAWQSMHRHFITVHHRVCTKQLCSPPVFPHKADMCGAHHTRAALLEQLVKHTALRQAHVTMSMGGPLSCCATPTGQANALAWHWHMHACSTNWSSTHRSVRPTSAFLRRACAEHADVRQTCNKSGVSATSTNYKKAKQWHSHFCWRCAATIGRQRKLLRPTRLSEKHGPALPAILPTCNLSSRRYHRPSISTHASHPAMHVCAPQ